MCGGSGRSRSWKSPTPHSCWEVMHKFLPPMHAIQHIFCLTTSIPVDGKLGSARMCFSTRRLCICVGTPCVKHTLISTTSAWATDCIVRMRHARGPFILHLYISWERKFRCKSWMPSLAIEVPGEWNAGSRCLNRSVGSREWKEEIKSRTCINACF